MSASPRIGEFGHARLAGDRYYTLDANKIVPALVKHLELDGRGVCEPAAGAGHLSDALAQNGVSVVAQHDISPGAPTVERADFFEFNALPAGARAIITNPPFDQIEAFARHALELTRPVRGFVAFLVRSEWTSAACRRSLVHQHPALVLKIDLTRRPRWVADSSGSPRHYFSWIVWDWKQGQSHAPARIVWEP
jgi:hypothetical protein